MGIDLQGLVDAMTSHALELARFERVMSHEPKNAPDADLTLAVFVASVKPAEGGSGLAGTSVVLTMTIRLYQGMLTEPQDTIDSRVMDAASALLDSFTGDFTLGDSIRHVDLLGIYGAPLGGDAGYVNVSGVLYRVFDINVPLVLDDVWAQSP